MYSENQMLNRMVIAIAVIGICVAARAADPELPNESVTFDGKTLKLAFSKANETQSLKEFIPEGQKLESWEQFAAIHQFPKLDDPKAAGVNLVRALKKQNDKAPYDLVENKTTGEVVVDFVTWPDDDKFVEFNVFKYAKRPDGGLVAQQYSVRNYNDQKKFLENLRPLRERLTKQMRDQGLKGVK